MVQQYAFGRHFSLESDHKPLEVILQKPLSRVPWRLQSVMMRLYLANMLSRAFLPFEGDDEDDFDFVNMVSYLPISDKRIVK